MVLAKDRSFDSSPGEAFEATARANLTIVSLMNLPDSAISICLPIVSGRKKTV
jgi:hypothetical protein